jgi:hypothetical protein
MQAAFPGCDIHGKFNCDVIKGIIKPVCGSVDAAPAFEVQPARPDFVDQPGARRFAEEQASERNRAVGCGRHRSNFHRIHHR